ncbi:type IV pilus biogenesis/stability protein PilW [Pseudoxanthomonas kalamensis]|uniref:type IV pilus biogenesis/stability protein PilW n=1 Tax=Pseudoxanthomonas kalamensis TaxID=289483 RepID=UPI003CCDCCB9
MMLLVVALLAAGCSRLTFIRPSPKIESFEPPKSEYNVQDSEATQQRLAVQERLALATQRLRSGDLDTAEREARTVLKESPDSADAYTLLAIIEERRGNAERAGEHYKRAAELAPRQGGALNNYGAWLCANGYPAESLLWFDRALATPNYPTPAAALANAGSCALDSGQAERAERDLRGALGLDSQNAVALAAMAGLKYRQGQYLDARAFSQRRLAAAPANPETLRLAAEIEEKLGDKAAASRYFDRLRTEFPDAGAASTGESARP